MNDCCDDALANLYLYLDEEMDGAEVEVIRTHLADCSPCTGAFDFEKRLKQVVRDRLQEEVPADLIARLRQAIEQS